MNKKTNASFILLLIAAGSLFATGAQSKSNDLSFRFSLGSAPGIDDADNFLGLGDVDDDEGARLELLAVQRLWDSNNQTIGTNIGGGLFFSSHSFSEQGLEVDVTAFGAMIQAGLVVDMGGGITFELSPYLGIGEADNETTGFSEGTGLYYLYGIKGSAFFLFGENIELGVDLGYEGFSQEQEYDFGFGVTREFTFSGEGAHVALVLGIHF